MVRNSIASKLETSPTCHSDRIISMHQQLKSNHHLTLFNVFDLNLMADSAFKNSLDSDLSRHFNSTPANDNVLILDDFNARVWKVSVAWKELLGVIW